MTILQRQTLLNGEEESRYSQADFLASHSVMPGDEEARKMTATSGRTCSAVLTKSNPIGLLLKILLESSRWSSKARFLRWQNKPLFSMRVTEFEDTDCKRPLPCNASAKILKITDTQSSQCLFRLVPLEHPTDETECSSSENVLLQTPTAVQTDEPPEKMRARAEKNGYKNGTKFGSLTSQIKYDQRVQSLIKPNMKNRPKVGDLLPTPRAMEIAEDPDKFVERNGDRQNSMPNLASMAKFEMLPTPAARDWKGKTNPGVVKEGSGCIYGETVPDAVARLFPTPTAIEGVKWTNTWNPNSQIGQSLSAMAGSGMLPTPRVGGQEGYESRAKRKGHECAMSYLETAVDYIYKQTKPDSDAGQTSRLSPLFTEEMMGFPFLWTALPFLRQSGEPKHSKPTETQ